MCRFCYRFVRWHRWDYHSFDRFWWGRDYLLSGHQCWVAALFGRRRNEVCSLSCQLGEEAVQTRPGHSWCHFFSYGVPYFCPTFSAAHCLWILELALYYSYRSRFTEGRSLYPCHVWILVGRDDFIWERVDGVVVASPSFLSMDFVQLSRLILGCFFLPSLC